MEFGWQTEDTIAVIVILAIIFLINTQLIKIIATVCIGKKYNFKLNPLAFLPFLNNIYLVLLIDNLDKFQGKRKVLKAVFISISCLRFNLFLFLPVLLLLSFFTGSFLTFYALWGILGMVTLYGILFPIFIVFFIIYYILYLYFIYDFYKLNKPQQRWLFLVLSAIGLDWLILLICGAVKEETKTSHNIEPFSAEQNISQTIKVTYIEEDI